MKEMLVCAFILLALCADAAAQDTIELNSGRAVAGRLIAENGTEITIQTGDTKLVLPKSMIRIMKIEEVRLELCDGRTLTGQIEKETDDEITLRMRLGGITVDRMDIDSIEHKVVERRPVIKESTRKEPDDDGQIPGLRKIRWPRRTGRLKWWQIDCLRGEGARLLQCKLYGAAIEKYSEILKSEPRDTMALYDIACAYALAGERDKALMHLRMAVAAGHADFEQIERNPDFDSIRAHKGYREVFRKRDAIQLQAARKELRKLKKQFGAGYTYEIDQKRKLIFATNQSLEMLERMKEHLSRFADGQCEMLWGRNPSCYITVVCPDREAYKKAVTNPSVAGLYYSGKKSLISVDIGQTLDHEFTHALHYADQDFRRMKAPSYITEGFATLFESSGMIGRKLVPRKVTGRFHTIKASASRGKHVPWERLRLMSHAQFMQKDTHLHYCQSRYMFVYLYETGRLKRWYDNYCETYHRDRTGRAAWEMTFCKILGEIERDWVAWLLDIKHEPRKAQRWDAPFLGAQFEECEEGVALYEIVLDSPAYDGGLREGDVLTHAGGKETRTYNNVIDILDAHKPGDKVEFKIVRGKKELTITVTLGKRPENE